MPSGLAGVLSGHRRSPAPKDVALHPQLAILRGQLGQPPQAEVEPVRAPTHQALARFHPLPEGERIEVAGDRRHC
jgi:hypothetical protein